MIYKNLISTEIPEKSIKEILQAISHIESLLPQLVELTREDRLSLHPLNEGGIAFINKALKIAIKNPEVLPPEIDLVEFKKDVDLIHSLEKILMPLKKIVHKLEDSRLLAGDEAYIPALTIFNTVETHKAVYRV